MTRTTLCVEQTMWLASLPSTSSCSSSPESFGARRTYRNTENAYSARMARLTANLAPSLIFRPSLGTHKHLSHQFKYVKKNGRFAVSAGLIEEKKGVESEREIEIASILAKEDPYLAAMLPGSKVAVNVTNLGNNTRKVEAKIAIHAPLEAVWGVLTDYDRLADHIPGLALSQVLERRPYGARLLQIGQKNLALGVKFKAKAVVEVTEEAAQEAPDGILRDLHFDTVEGDFQVFKGTWHMHQVGGHSKTSTKASGVMKRVETYLSYILEVQPKKWIPVALIEGVVCHEITCNLVSVRDVAVRQKPLSSHD